MDVEVVPLTEFTHGRYNLSEGRPVMIPAQMAAALERKGLVRVKIVQRRVDQTLTGGAGGVIVGDAGKVPDDGRGQPSSASPAAQASPTKTSRSSKAGAG